MEPPNTAEFLYGCRHHLEPYGLNTYLVRSTASPQHTHIHPGTSAPLDLSACTDTLQGYTSQSTMSKSMMCLSSEVPWLMFGPDSACSIIRLSSAMLCPTIPPRTCGLQGTFIKRPVLAGVWGV